MTTDKDFLPCHNLDVVRDSDMPLSGIITPSGYRFYDNSTLNDARVCMRRFYFKAIRHFDTMGEKASLEFGSSWHSAMDSLWAMCQASNSEKFTKSQVIEMSFDSFQKRWFQSSMPEREEFDLYPRTPGRAKEMLEGYYDRYAEQLSGIEVINIERPFIIPLSDDEQRLMYIGKLDKVFKSIHSRNVSILDHKTAANFGNTWVNSFSPNSQFDGYFHAGKMLWGDDFDTIYVDGAVVQKTKIDFMRLPLMRQISAIAAWNWETLDLISQIEYYEAQLKEIRYAMQKGKRFDYLPTFPKCSTSCTNYYGCCPYLDICKFQNNPEEHWLQEGFEERQWKPFEITEKPDGTFDAVVVDGE